MPSIPVPPPGGLLGALGVVPARRYSWRCLSQGRGRGSSSRSLGRGRLDLHRTLNLDGRLGGITHLIHTVQAHLVAAGAAFLLRCHRCLRQAGCRNESQQPP